MPTPTAHAIGEQFSESHPVAAASARMTIAPRIFGMVPRDLHRDARPGYRAQPMPAPHFHLSFGSLVQHHEGAPTELRRACAAEPIYTRLGSIFHDLPYYGNMLLEAIRYGLEAPALDEPWAYRMHSVRPARFIASYLRAAAVTPGLSADERLPLAARVL